MGSIKVAKEWLSYSNTDLIGAKALVEMGDAFLPLAAFHAQQSAEKSLKAVLVFNSVRVPKTHDLSELIALLGMKDTVSAVGFSGVEILTDYAVSYRYPDAQKSPLTYEEVQSAILLAQRCLEICLLIIK